MRINTARNLLIFALFCLPLAFAQDAGTPTIPRLVRLSGSFRPVNGLALGTTEGATVSIYRDRQGGVPLWQETQNVSLDIHGRYSVLVGVTQQEGLPAEYFSTAQPRWLGIRFNRPGEVERPRVPLKSFPSGLKPADADMLAGRRVFALDVPASDPDTVVPSSCATSDCPGSLPGIPSISAEFQQVYAASLFTSVHGPISITGVGVRPAPGVNTVTGLDFTATVKAETTNINPDAGCTGTDGTNCSYNTLDPLNTATTVFSGTQHFTTNNTGTPRPFDFQITFSTPFKYDPTTGQNLLLDLNIPTNGFENLTGGSTAALETIGSSNRQPGTGAVLLLFGSQSVQSGIVVDIQYSLLYATISSPTPGSTLSGPSATFMWDAVSGADQYRLDVGTSLGQADICSITTTNTSSTCSSIPTNGSTIYVQLWTHISGAFETPIQYTYTAATATPAQLTSPANHSTLSGPSVTFTWGAAAGADEYKLDVGTALGLSDICTSGITTNTSFTCSSLPTNGSTIFVQLATHLFGVFQTPVQYTYTAASVVRAQLTSPANNSTLSGSSVTFTWGAVAGADQYWLDVGTAVGQGNLCAGATTNTSSTCSGIPTNGSTIFVQLWTHLFGAWQTPIQYTFTASTALTKAQLTSPANNSTFSGSSVTFTWGAVTGADQYWLDVGTVVGQGNICGGATTNTSSTCSGIPTNGSAIFVQLWTHISGAWQTPIQYTFTAATVTIARAQLTSPANNSTLTGSSVTFTWGAVTGADQYWLDVGTVVGQGNICGGATTNTSSTCSGIPTNGSTIFVQLFTHIAGAWQTPIQYTFTAATGTIARAQLTSPANNSTLSGSSVTFTWGAVTGADQYWLDVGTSLGQGNICGGATTNTFSTCSGIPTNHSTIFVQLWTHISGAWQTPIQYTFTASSTATAQLISPVANSVLSGSAVTFTWGAVAGADQYWLDVGTVIGQGNICGGATTNISATCSGIPTNGSTIYVQVWTHISGVWQSPNQYTFTAARLAQLTSPANHSVLPGSSVTFTWSAVTGADQYWLDVGTALGKGDICGGATTNTSSTCSGIPTNGSTIYVQVWTHISGVWQTPNQYTFTAF